MKPGKLYLIPTVIADKQSQVIPEQVRGVIEGLDYYLVENLRTARRYISSLKLGLTIEELQFEQLDKKTPYAKVQKLLQPLAEGKNVGIMSESGCPGIADPGSLAVNYAHEIGATVVPLVGPSSIFLTLMASGFNGQQFAFHGYLPIDKKHLDQKIKALEEESLRKNQTQLFIETPYRNNQLLEQLKKQCYPQTQLCVARDVSGKDEFIKTASITAWRQIALELHKIPTVFALFAGSMER